MDNIDLYHMEKHLFDTVGPSFRETGALSAFDFFCIVIWKANRAKSKVARKLLSHDAGARRGLDAIVRDLTASLYAANGMKERLRLLVEDWGFRLPMATAVLTVLWPDYFTVYDVRVCDALGAHHGLQYRTNFAKLWSGYQEFKKDVADKTPQVLSLRDKDRFLWGKSFRMQLESDIKTLFSGDDTVNNAMDSDER